MIRLRHVVLAFLLLLSVFLITHALKFPGSVAYLMEVTHGQRMLDMQASFSSAETYQRLEGFGERGRSAYMRTILTVDLIFPVTAFLFLFVWARYASERAAMRPSISRAACGLDGVSAGVSHGCVRRFAAAVMATNLALAFLGLCLASCLAPADAHACCRSKSPTISAETDGCWLDTDGVRAAADGLPANSSLAAVMHPVSLNPPAAPFHGAPRVAASPPLVLRI